MLRYFIILLPLIGCSEICPKYQHINENPVKFNSEKLEVNTVNLRHDNANFVLPMKNELLDQPIKLECLGLNIIEWKSTIAFKNETSLNEDSIHFINSLCSKSFEEYPKYLWDNFKWTPLTTEHKFQVNISLLPANASIDGQQYRNLNDLNHRFLEISDRDCCNWGMYFEPLNYLVIRNDPMVRRSGRLVPYDNFAKTFVHELAHIMNDKFGYHSKYFSNEKTRDEKLAIDFSVWMGYKFPTESGEEDLKNKLL